MYNFFKTTQFVLVSMKGTYDEMKYMYKQSLCVSPLFCRQTEENQSQRKWMKKKRSRILNGIIEIPFGVLNIWAFKHIYSNY